MAYLFTSPTASDTPRLSFDRGVDRRTDRLMQHVRQPDRGLHVLRESGVWTELSGQLTTEREQAADLVLYGGHDTVVSDAYAAELIAAGYGENLTVVPNDFLTDFDLLLLASSLSPA